MSDHWITERISPEQLQGMVADWLGESLTGTLIRPIQDIVLATYWRDRLYVLGVPFEVTQVFGIPVRFSDLLADRLAILNHADGVPTIVSLWHEGQDVKS